MMLKLTNLIFGYPLGFRSKPLTLEVEENHTIGFCGPNGAGKTTLLKTILGIIKPLEGSYAWKRSYRRSYLPQASDTSALLPITVKEILRAATDKKIEEALEKLKDPFGIRDLLHASFHSLSGGQKQRVLMTRTFLASPEVLFLDEPNNHVDQKTREIFWSFISQMKPVLDLKGIFIIDHDLASLKKYADRIFTLKEIL